MDGTIASVNPDGYWYRISSSPWNNSYYAAANTFLNGDPPNGPYSHNTDFAVPDCTDSRPAAPSKPSPESLSKYADTIVEWSGDNKAQRTSWLVGPDLKRRWIPDVATYNCLVTAGKKKWPTSLPSSTLDRLTDLTGTSATCGYVALGDSYSSGEGNPPFSDVTCRRSYRAWPYTAHRSTTPLIKNIACSGAVVNNLVSPWTARGQAAQITAAASLHPEVVTVTIGGNDLGFSSILGDCYTSVTPFAFGCDTNGSTAGVRRALPGLQRRLAALYSTLKSRLGGARVIVVGYPRIFPTAKAHNCAWLSDSERKELNAVSGEIDQTIKAAASQAGVGFVSVLGVLAGHELCTADAWVTPIEPSCGLPKHTNCGHPTVDGQLAIARKVGPVLNG